MKYDYEIRAVQIGESKRLAYTYTHGSWIPFVLCCSPAFTIFILP